MTIEQTTENERRPIYKWSATYSFGICELDEHQSEFFSILNDLYYAMMTKCISEEIRNIGERIIRYTAVQFTVEKSFLEKYHYPDRDAHLEQHKVFKQTVYSYQERLKIGDVFILLEIANFLRSWLSDHIAKEDRALGAFLTARSCLE